MKVIVDTNIIFSAILNTNSKLGRILLYPDNKNIKFYSTTQLQNEIEEHKDKLIKLSGYSNNDFIRIKELILRKIRFINNQLISEKAYQFSESLTSDVDIDDTEFIALCEHLNGKLWTGDKKLQKGLLKKGWDHFITPDELIEKLTHPKQQQ